MPQRARWAIALAVALSWALIVIGCGEAEIEMEGVARSPDGRMEAIAAQVHAPGIAATVPVLREVFVRAVDGDRRGRMVFKATTIPVPRAVWHGNEELVIQYETSKNSVVMKRRGEVGVVEGGRARRVRIAYVAEVKR
jgi:hypothetical protein